MMNAKEKPRYHLHGLQGFSRATYEYIGSYKHKWLAEMVAKQYVYSNPYGCVSITRSKDKPKITGG